MKLLWICFAVGMFGCSSNDAQPEGCPAVPTTTEVSCEPLKAGDTHDGCQGIPADPVGPEKATRTTERFPAGCRVTFPHVNGAYACGGQFCDCQTMPSGDGGTSLQWNCPL